MIHVTLSRTLATLAPNAHLPRAQVPGSAGEGLRRVAAVFLPSMICHEMLKHFDAKAFQKSRPGQVSLRSE